MNEPHPSLVRQVKQRLKPLYVRGQRALARTMFGYTTDALESAIRSLGIATGDCLLVHSGFRRSSGFRGTPSDVINCLTNIVGPTGHVLMMSIPYRGSSQAYAAHDPLFDVRRTPSAVGVISEVFRRRDDVVRSLSPLHPVVAWGPLAAWLTADHEKFAYSCGKGSPFERFLNHDGTFLFYDAPYGSLTFMHYVEDRFRDRLPVELYDPEPMMLRVKDASGRDHQVRQFVFSKAARERRNFAPIEQRLRQEGRIRTTRVGNTHLLRVKARDVVDCADRLVREGTGFYR
jgi:aminoglycoside 3-N-acetyltransferase